MPLYSTNDNMYYSWNVGLVHFAAINFDFALESEEAEVEGYTIINQTLYSYMINWLQNDLEEANNNRQLRPWIIVYSHRPIYCSKMDEPDCLVNYQRFSEVDDLLHQYSVDLYMSGHVHAYERMLPIYNDTVYPYCNGSDSTDFNYIINPQATVHIIQGKAGHHKDKEEEGPDEPYDPSWRSAFVSDLWSYAALHIINETTLLWENYVSHTGLMNDYMFLIKNVSNATCTVTPVPNPSGPTSGVSDPIWMLYSAIGLIGIMILIMIVLGVKNSVKKPQRLPYTENAEQNNLVTTA